MQVTDCYSEPHMFVEVSDLQPWIILSLNNGALKTTGETRTYRIALVRAQAAL